MPKLFAQPLSARFKSLRCLMKGHVFVDSRSQVGTQVCVRCKHRRPFENCPAATDDPA